MLLFYYDAKYVVIIGDIIDSRGLIDRRDVQNKLRMVLSDINRKYSQNIVSDFSIALGDEFQGLLKNGYNIIDIIFEIEMAMSPIEFRFGVGIGDVSTDTNNYKTFEIDGSAYHRARKMIQEIESTKNQYSERYANIMICSEDENREIDELLNSTLSICSALKSKWTNRQKEIIYAYMNNCENQYKTAHNLKISQPSVNKALINSRFYSYKYAINTVNKFLSKER